MESIEVVLANVASNQRTLLFDALDGCSPTAEWFDRFDANFRLRTLLTIPEVFSVGVVVSNYLHFEGMAALGSIAADETGVSRSTLQPNVSAVHSVLLCQAFDTHRQVVFSLPPLDSARLLGLIRVLDSLVNQKFDSSLESERWELIRTDLKFIGQDFLKTFRIPERFSSNTSEMLIRAVADALTEFGVTPQTIDYCFSQFRMQRCSHPARIVGRALMHEHLADNMLSTIEQTVFLPFYRSCYAKGSIYEERVAPYFLAHRDDAKSSYIELEHAIRMRTIAAPFLKSPQLRGPLLQEAQRFAYEQKQLFDALVPSFQENANSLAIA